MHCTCALLFQEIITINMPKPVNSKRKSPTEHSDKTEESTSNSTQAKKKRAPGRNSKQTSVNSKRKSPTENTDKTEESASNSTQAKKKRAPVRNSKQSLIKSLPAALKSCVVDEWKIIIEPNNHPFVVLTEQEYAEQFESKMCIDTFVNMASNLEEYLSRYGLPDEMGYSFMALLSSEAAELIAKQSTELLVKDGYGRMSKDEFYHLIATHLIRSRIKLPTKLAYDEFLEALEIKHGIKLMKPDRYTTCIHRLRGYPLQGRSGFDSSDCWFQRNNLLRRLEPIEKMMFEQSRQILMNTKGGELVLDDELLGSRAKDVETKTLSHRKAGKEGPVFDAVACSHTSAVLGVRLRVRGCSELDNITELLSVFPTIRSVHQSVGIKFDRGYGKRKTLGIVGEKGYRMSTVVSTVGSGHPFISYEVAEAYKEELTKKKDKDKAAKVALFNEFVLDGNDLCGPQIWVAKSQIKVGDNDRQIPMYGTAIRYVHDKKVVRKDLRFFSTCPDSYDTSKYWIATDKALVVHGGFLFSSIRTTNERETVQATLLQSCYPLTIAQRTGDWFLMRKFRITGTISSSLPNVEDLESDESKRKLLEQFNDSHHNRQHRSTKFMQQGSMNEEPLLEKLEAEEWVHQVFEVGMLQRIEDPWLAVSPDAIIVASVSSPDGLFQEDEEQIMFVEMKTRLAGSTISKSIDSWRKHGRLVYCNYGDECFNNVVPSSNRSQLIHQAMVTNLNYGVFVTSVADGEEAEMVQMVVIRFAGSDKQNHYHSTNEVGQLLFGWMYDEELLGQGFLKVSDIPEWLTSNQVEIVSSQYPLWSAVFNKVRNGGTNGIYKPLKPVGTFKHFSQYNYNHGKWGVDKSTELADSLSVDGIRLCFETAYIMRMIEGVVVNFWRARQARDIIRPFVSQFTDANDGRLPSLNQLRNKLHNTTEMALEPFCFKLGIDLIKLLQSSRYLEAINPLFLGQALTAGENAIRCATEADKEFIDALEARSSKNKWPVMQRKLLTFSRQDILNRLRRHVSTAFPHTQVSNPRVSQKNGGVETMVVSRQRCALCIKGKKGRKTFFMCNTCKVPLCTTVLKGEDENAITHFALWHSCIDLIVARDRCHAVLVASTCGAVEGDEEGDNDGEENEGADCDEEVGGTSNGNFEVNFDVAVPRLPTPEPVETHTLLGMSPSGQPARLGFGVGTNGGTPTWSPISRSQPENSSNENEKNGDSEENLINVEPV